MNHRVHQRFQTRRAREQPVPVIGEILYHAQLFSQCIQSQPVLVPQRPDEFHHLLMRVVLIHPCGVERVEEQDSCIGGNFAAAVQTIGDSAGWKRLRLVLRHCAPREAENGDPLRLALVEQGEIVLGQIRHGTVLTAHHHVYFHQAGADADYRAGPARPAEGIKQQPGRRMWPTDVASYLLRYFALYWHARRRAD